MSKKNLDDQPQPQPNHNHTKLRRDNKDNYKTLACVLFLLCFRIVTARGAPATTIYLLYTPNTPPERMPFRAHVYGTESAAPRLHFVLNAAVLMDTLLAPWVLLTVAAPWTARQWWYSAGDVVRAVVVSSASSSATSATSGSGATSATSATGGALWTLCVWSVVAVVLAVRLYQRFVLVPRLRAHRWIPWEQEVAVITGGMPVVGSGGVR